VRKQPERKQISKLTQAPISKLTQAPKTTALQYLLRRRRRPNYCAGAKAASRHSARWLAGVSTGGAEKGQD